MSAPAALAVAVAAVSLAAVLIREARAPALAIAFWRTALGAVLFAPGLAHQRRRGSTTPRFPAWWVLASGTCLALHFALWIGSLGLTTVASSVTLVTMAPIFVGVLSSGFLGEKVSRYAWLGIGVTVLGAALIGFADGADPGSTSNALLGDGLALAGAAALAGYIVIGRAMRKGGMANSAFVVPTYAVAAVGLGVVSLVAGVELAGYSGRTWLLIGAIVLGPQMLGHGTMTWVLDRLSATTVSVATLAEPIGATFLAWIVLDELPSDLFWLGAPVVLGGLIIALRAEALSQKHAYVHRCAR